MYCRADPLSMPPQVGVGGGMPKPRKLKAASVIMISGTRVVNRIIVGAIRLGRICRIRILLVEQPIATLA
jgi:hypothetical protein